MCTGSAAQRALDAGESASRSLLLGKCATSPRLRSSFKWRSARSLSPQSLVKAPNTTPMPRHTAVDVEEEEEEAVTEADGGATAAEAAQVVDARSAMETSPEATATKTETTAKVKEAATKEVKKVVDQQVEPNPSFSSNGPGI